MPAKKSSKLVKSATKSQPASLKNEVQDAMSWLESKATKRDRENLDRFAISVNQALGVSMANVKLLGKKMGQWHELALALWQTGWYEARLLAAMVDEPARVTSAQMDQWCRDFDNWGICDTVCFHLFDRTSFAWAKVSKWSNRREEFVKRASFALLWALALHDKRAADQKFLNCLPYIERAATDERNFVKKSVNMALRAIGVRSYTLNKAAVTLAGRLAKSTSPTARWVGKTTLRELKSPASIRRISR